MDKTCLQCGAIFDGNPRSKYCPRCAKIRLRAYHKKYYENHPRSVNTHMWKIQSPSGEIYECHSLLGWLKEHEDMINGTPEQACNGISKIKYSMQGKRKNPCFQWKGWKLLAWGEKRNEKKI